MFDDFGLEMPCLAFQKFSQPITGKPNEASVLQFLINVLQHG